MRIEVNGETAYCYTNSRDIEAEKPTVVFIHGSGMDHTCLLYTSPSPRD